MTTQASENVCCEIYFSCDAEDSREYKRWKTWVSNKLLTLDKLLSESRGAYIYTLLTGKVLEAVEDLEPSAYQKQDGDKVLWAILDQPFPQKEKVDGETFLTTYNNFPSCE